MSYREQFVTTTTVIRILTARRIQNDVQKNHEKKTANRINSRERKREKF